MRGIEFGDYLTEQKQYERKYYRKDNKLNPLGSEHEHLRESQVQQKDNGHVDQIIGREDCSQQTLRIRKQSRCLAPAETVIIRDTFKLLR